MKYSLALISLLTFTSTQSFAWRVGPFKGDDPKIIVDIVEETKRGSTTVSDFTRDAIGYVGNATGISSIIESNKKTLMDIGTVQACIATLCYSEVVKKKQLEEAEEQARADYQNKVADAQRYYNRLTKESRINRLTGIMQSSQQIINTLTQQADLYKKQGIVNTAVVKALNTQEIWAEAMARQGVKELPKLAKTDMTAVASALEQNINRDSEKALNDLNAQLLELEKTAGRTRAELLTDLIYTLNSPTSKTLKSILEISQGKNSKELAEIEGKIRDEKARYESALSAYNKEKA